MFCQQCHILLRDEAKFCTSCGRKQESIAPPLSNLSTSLSLFSLEEWRESLRSCAPDARLELIEEILKNLEQDSLIALYTLSANVLFDQSMSMLRHPHTSFGNDAPKGFENAKKYILSKNKVEQEKGLILFEGMNRGRQPSSSDLLHEWFLFAQASVYGPAQIASQWREKWRAKDPSWDVVWNLAVSYTLQADFHQALEVLRPGIDSRKAPFTHLRFALYCAMQCLIQPSFDKRETISDFLRVDVYKWPWLECYLVWLSLKIQRGLLHDATEQGERAAICRALDSLLLQPIVIPDPETILEKKEVQSFTEHLEHLGFTENLLFWLNSYTRHSYTKFGRAEDRVSRFKGLDFERWHEASGAYERAGDSRRAGKILYGLAREQQKLFLEQRKGNTDASPSAFLSMSERLVELFAFYQRHGMLHEEKTFGEFVKFYKRIPEVWEDSRVRNEKLIDLTQSLLTKYKQPKPEVERVSGSMMVENAPLSNPGHSELLVQSHSEMRQRVGLFVDLENVAGMFQSAKVENVGTALLKYARQFGLVACSWVAADLRNLGESMQFQEQLKRTGFQPRQPHDEPQTGKADKKLADFVLIETIHHEKCSTRPNVYIIVSGDKDFYECIITLIESGATVRLCAPSGQNRIAEKYKRLECERYRIRRAENCKSDFFIDDLESVLKGTSNIPRIAQRGGTDNPLV